MNNNLVSGEIEISQTVHGKVASAVTSNSTSHRTRKSASQSLDSRRTDNKAVNKKRLSDISLKKHLKYIVPELKLALIKEPGVKPHEIHGPQEIRRLIEPMKFYPEEHFVAFHLDTKFQVIGYNEVSKGTVSASLVHPREVFKAALLSSSTAIICAHNHPSGIVKPSDEDIETTRTLIKAGEILGVLVLDHVIIGGDDLYSLRENRPDLWP
ncbi:hypothetical protein BH11CYA1_BH11CYA1_48760 [soil metagenome]